MMDGQRLPQILIIDDFLGGPDGDDYREGFCAALSLLDVDRVPQPEIGNKEYLAQAKFESGQHIDSMGRSANSEVKALDAIHRGWPFENGERWALVCIDLQFDVGEKGFRCAENFGASLLKRIETEFGVFDDKSFSVGQTQLPIVMLSAHPPEAVEMIVGSQSNVPCIRRWKDQTEVGKINARIEFGKVMFKESLAQDGALRYVSKDGTVCNIFRKKVMMGCSYALLNALRHSRRILSKNRDARVLITGEQGTGKELLVSYLHDCRAAAKAYERQAGRDWRQGALEVVHLKELPDALFSAALKGTEKGFATQVMSNESTFERAGTGTVHLDEIGNLTAENLQILLRLVENDEFRRIGGTVSVPIKCQVVATTNKDIQHKVERGEFPSDLFDRFDKLYLPPLRERAEDIQMLFRTFLDREVTKLGCRPKRIHSEAFTWMAEKYEWRGNIRQLGHVVENIVAHREYASNIYLRDVQNGVKMTGADLQRNWGGRFSDLLRAIENYKFGLDEVDGAWPRLRAALGSLLGDLVETAGGRSKVRAGRVNRVACVSLIRGPEPGGEKLDATGCRRWLQFIHKELAADGVMIRHLINQVPKKKKR
jgi:transcriptional regulator with AAA-type ATPase domain